MDSLFREIQRIYRKKTSNDGSIIPVSRHKSFIAGIVFLTVLSMADILPAEPDSLPVFALSDTITADLPDGWIPVLPKKQKAYTNYIIERSGEDPFLSIRSGGTGSWIEKKLEDIDLKQTPFMEWSWRVLRFPELEWEGDREQDDFAIRIELIYDYRGGAFNILNFIRKGLITSLLRGNPPVLTISYVWAHKVPAGRPYTSPSDNKTIVIPIESGANIRGIWITERRNISEDLQRYTKDKRIVLKKIRIRSDTDDSLSSAESGLKKIELRTVLR